MTDAPSAPPAPAADGGGDAAAAGAAAVAAAAPKEWMQGLPADLQGDATLARYDNLEALARGHVETKRALSNGLAVPGADATPEQWGKVWDALGRPKDAESYDIPIGEGVDPETFKPYRELAHRIGLSNNQAKALAEFDAQRMTAAENDFYAEGQRDVDALKAEMGADYEPQRLAAKAAFTKIFGEDAADVADELDRKVGSGRLVKGMMNLAKIIGEAPRVDGTPPPGGSVADSQAEARLKTLQADKGWRDKLNAGDAATKAEYSRLLDAAKRHAATGG